MTSDIS